MTGQVCAEDNGWYAGLNIGTTDVGIICPTSPCKDSGNGWRLFAGYQISEIWGVQASYLDLGKVTSGLASIEFDGFDVLGTANWDINDQWSIFGEFGYYSLNADFTAGPKTDGGDWTGGFGITRHVNDNTAVRLEYQIWNSVGEMGITDESDVELLSVGFVYSF
ncbi:MAG: outer membrane beta-barrel protein [Woeseiaceae bacterium]